MVAGFLGPLSTLEQISACRCFSASPFISKENKYNILMFPCHPITPILLLCFSSSITKGRWSLKAPRSSLLEDAIMLVTSESFFSWMRPWLRSGLTQVIEELSLNWGQLPLAFIPTGHFPPNTHIYTQFLGPQFPCGFPFEHEMQDGVYISSS